VIPSWQAVLLGGASAIVSSHAVRRCSLIWFGLARHAHGAGFIIGKGGRNIDQIEKASGAKLSVSDRNGPESFGKEWVYVQVSCERISTLYLCVSLFVSLLLRVRCLELERASGVASLTSPTLWTRGQVSGTGGNVDRAKKLP
jgi:hypothetical protein